MPGWIANALIACFRLRIATIAMLGCIAICTPPLIAQDDITTQNAGSALGGGWITGPASNPLSLLNGPANRTSASNSPYDFPDFHPAKDMDSHLPRWINFEAEERFRFEGYQNRNFHEGSDDSYLLNRFRFQADLRLASWFKVVSQVQDARPFLENPPIGPPNENRWDIKLAYAEFGNPDKSWISARVGRQVINYNNTLIANSEWRNQARSYDAVITNLQRGRYHLGIFAASVVMPLASGISHHQEGDNIYGLYGRIENAIPNSSLEPFLLCRVQPSVPIEVSASSGTGKQDMKVYGLRMKGRVRTNLDYSAEVAGEFGSDGHDPIRAWAMTGGAAYEFRSVPARPRAFAQYDFASGNSNPIDGVHRTFDTIYPTAHDRFGMLDLFGWQNIRSWRAGATVNPHRRWTVTAQYLDFWLASTNDAVYNISGGIIAYNSGASHSSAYLGREADVYTWYELNSHVNIGAGYGHFGTGAVLAGLATAHEYSGPYVAINFKDHGRSKGQ